MARMMGTGREKKKEQRTAGRRSRAGRTHTYKSVSVLLLAFLFLLETVYGSAGVLISSAGTRTVGAEVLSSASGAAPEVEESGGTKLSGESEEEEPENLSEDLSGDSPEDAAPDSPEPGVQEDSEQAGDGNAESVVSGSDREEPEVTQKPSFGSTPVPSGKAEKEEKKKEDTRSDYTYNDGRIRVSAHLQDPKAVPDDAVLRVQPITNRTAGYSYQAYMDALNAEAGTPGKVAYTADNTWLYDVGFFVTPTDEDGNVTGDEYEYEPEAGSVSIHMQIVDADLAKCVEKEETVPTLTHLRLADLVKLGADTTEQVTGASASDVICEEMAGSVSVSGYQAEVAFSLDSFSAIAITVPEGSGNHSAESRVIENNVDAEFYEVKGYSVDHPEKGEDFLTEIKDGLATYSLPSGMSMNELDQVGIGLQLTVVDPENRTLMGGDYFDLKIPEFLIVDESAVGTQNSPTVVKTDDNRNEILTYYKLPGENTIRITFTDAVNKSNYLYNITARLSYVFQVNQKLISALENEQLYEIEMANGQKIRILVLPRSKEILGVSKEGKIDKTDQKTVTWTVIAGSDGSSRGVSLAGVTLTDTFNSKEQKIRSVRLGEQEIYTEDGGVSDSALSFVTAESDGTIRMEYVFPENTALTAPATFTVVTEVTEAAVEKANRNANVDTKVSNQVRITGDPVDETKEKNSDQAEVTIPVVRLTKSGEQIGGDRIRWTINLNSSQSNVYKCVVKDTMTGGLVLDPDTVRYSRGKIFTGGEAETPVGTSPDANGISFAAGEDAGDGTLRAPSDGSVGDTLHISFDQTFSDAYTITFETTIDQERAGGAAGDGSGSVDLANTSQYKNSATVLVYFPDGSGSGPSVEYGVPDIGTEMYTLYLTKQVSTRTVPDPKTGLISWELVPGTRLQTGKTAELCDTIPEGHTLMKDSFRIVYRDPDANGAEKELTEGTDYEITGIPDNTDGSVSGIAKSGNDLQVTLKNADAVRDLSHVMFTVVTRDDKYLGGNVRSRSVNRATILLTEDSGKVFTSNEATAENTWVNELLSKKGEVVCSSKNEPLFHYTIWINRKANRLTDVVFEDDFTEGNAQSNLIYYTSGGKKYALDREEYTILGADAAQYKPVIRDSVGRVLSSDKVTVDVQNDAAGKKITAAWKEPLEDACVLEFYVKIHTDSVDFYEKEGFLGTDSSGQEALPVTFGADNTCALRFKPRNKKDAEVTASAGSEAALSASVLGKKGLYNKEGRTNSWTIDINPAGMSLSTGSGNPVLRDTVPAIQNLQKKTIVLCRVDQSTSPNGMIQLFDGSKDAFGAENGNRVKVTVKKVRSGITNLQIDFPSDAGTSAYRLTYNTVVTKAAAADAVSNTAELTWGSAPHTAFVTATAEALASGSASANQFSMMTMTKVDALSVDGTPIPIPFAEYELYTKDENGAVDEVVDSAWTDANGQITFVCDTGKEYYIKEVAAPEVTDDLGYALDSQEYGPYEPKPGPQDICPRNAAGSSMKKYFTDERDTSLFKTGSVEVTKIFDKSDPQADYTGVGSSNGYQAGFQLLIYPNGKSGKSRVVDTLLETSAEGVYVYDQKSADSENNAQASLSVVKTGASKANTSGLQEAKLLIRNLPWGQYALQEVDSQQPGYVKNAKLYYFNVSKVTSGDASVVFEDSETGDNRVTIHNVPTKLTVKKLDASGNAIGGGADGALAEAEFLLTATDKSNFALSTNVQYPLSDDKLSFMLRGNEFSDDGTLSLSGILVHGESYTLKEVKPPAGYTTAAAVTGIKGGDAVEAVVKDTKTSFTFKKTDQNGEKVAGATLTLKGRFADTADGSRIPATAASPEVVFSGAGVQQEAVWTTTVTKADVTFTGKLIAGETYLLTESMEDQSGQYTEPKAEIRLQVSEDGKKITLTGGNGAALAATAATADTDAKDASVGIGAYITGVNTVNIRNHRYLASFSFEKVDNTAEKNGISGAVFKLERLKEDPQDPSRKVTDQTMQGIATNADGKFISSGSSLTNVFYGSTVANRKLSKGIPVGTYVLTETKAPDGYYTNPDLTWEFAVTADDDGKTVVRTASAGDPGEGALVNYIRPVTLRITKRDVNDSTKVLKGAEYTLYTDKDCKTKADTMNASFLQEKTDGTAADTYANPQVTDDRGEIRFASLPWGTYYLKETKAPKSYRRDVNTYRIVVGRDGVSFGNNSEVSDSRLGRLTENLTENEGGRIRVYETELSDSPTQLYVVKTDQFGKNADGVILTIYEADGTTKIDEFEFTGHQDVKDAPKWNLTGKLNAGGTYIIRETYRDEAAEKKYQKPHETGDVTKRIDKYTVHVSENGSAWELDALEDGYVLTGTSADPELKNDVALNIDQGSVLGIVNKRIMGTTAILQKAAVNSNANDTGKKYKYLDGAVFALYQEGAQGSWTKIKEFTTGNGYGFLTTSNFDDYVDENKFTENGGLVAGNYMLKEVRAPKGYQINPTEYGFSVDSASDGKVIVIDSKTPDQPITDYRLEDMIPKWPDSYPGTPVLDEPIPGQIRVKKTASDGTSPLEGAVFELYEDKACTTPAEYYDTFDRTNGSATGGIATNADGEAVFYGLAWDTVYWVKEIAAPTGYAVNGSVQPVRITAGDYRNTIDLEDAPAGEASGTKISAGVTETTVVDGDQVKVEADVAFSDAKTEITIVKDDQNQQLTYEDGVELSVYAEEQKKEDGSFEGEPVYRWTAGSRPLSGSASQTGSSGNDPADGGQTENPNARVISGILTAGCTYELVEKDNTMFCHEDPVEFRIDAEGKIVLPNGKNRDGRVFTDAEGKVLTLTNRRIFSGAAFVKTDAENSFKKLEKAEYGLYWAGGYLGGYSVDADTLLQVFVTDGNGLVSTVGNMTKDTIAEGAKLNDRQKSLLAEGLLPGHYYFRETDAPFYYAKSDTKYAFTIDESCDGKVVLLGENAAQSGSFVKGTVPLTDGQQKETLEAKLRKAAEDGETYVTDQRLPGVIELDKVRKDHISEHVGGAEYSVFTARACTEKDLAAKEGSAFDPEKDFENRVVTDSDGLAVFANLKWGRYYIKETKAAPGYQIDPYVYEVVVGENSYGDSVSLRGLSEQNGHILSTWTGEDAIYTFITVQDYANTLTISKQAQIFANQASKESGTEAQGGALFRIRLLDKDLNPTVSTTQNLSTDRDSGKILWERQQVGLIQGYAYQIEEVEAPEGYMLIAPIRFMIMDDYGTVQLLDGDNRPAREVTVTDAEGEEREGASLVARVEQSVKTETGQQAGSSSGADESEDGQDVKTRLCDFTIVITNPQQDNRIVLTKTDRCFGTPVRDAKYQLYESREDLTDEIRAGTVTADDSRLTASLDADGKEIILQTNADGEAVFTHLTPGKYYYVTEKAAPSGYRLDGRLYAAGKFRSGVVDEPTYHGETKELKVSDVPVSSLKFTKVLLGNEDEGNPSYLPLQGVQFAFYTDEEAKTPYRIAQMTGKEDLHEGSDGHGSGTQADPAAASGETEDSEEDCVIPSDLTWTGGLEDNKIGAEAVALTGGDGTVNITGLPHTVLYMKEVRRETGENDRLRENRTIYRVDLTGKAAEITAVTREPGDGKTLRVEENNGKTVTQIVNRYTYGSVSVVKLDREDYLGRSLTADGEEKEPKMTAIAGSAYGLFRRADTILEGPQTLQQVSTGTAADAASEDAGSESDGRTEETAGDVGNTKTTGETGKAEENSGTRNTDDMTDGGIWVQVAQAETNSYGRITFDRLIPGYDYKIQEVAAPAGYRKSRSAFYFSTSLAREETAVRSIVAVTPEKAAPEDAAFRDTAQTDSTLATDEDGALLMEGDSYVWLEPQIMLSVKKVDAAGKYLAGAGFEIRDESGKVLVSWTSGEAAKILSGSDTAAMETGRTYLLYEVQIPEGYATAEPVSFVVEDKRVGGQELYVQDIDRVVNVTCTPSPTPEAQTSESAQITPPTKTGGRPGTTLTPEPNKSEGTSPTPAGGGSQDQTPAPEGAQTGDKPTVPLTREEVEQTVDIARLPRTDSVPDGGYEIEISDGQSVVFDSNGEVIGLRSAVQTGDSSGIMRELYIFVAVGLILLVLIIKKHGFGRN